jgi:hypothetical protein
MNLIGIKNPNWPGVGGEKIPNVKNATTKRLGEKQRCFYITSKSSEEDSWLVATRSGHLNVNSSCGERDISPKSNSTAPHVQGK